MVPKSVSWFRKVFHGSGAMFRDSEHMFHSSESLSWYFMNPLATFSEIREIPYRKQIFENGKSIGLWHVFALLLHECQALVLPNGLEFLLIRLGGNNYRSVEPEPSACP